MPGQELGLSQDSGTMSTVSLQTMATTTIDHAEDVSPSRTPVPGSLNRRYTDFLHVARQPSMRQHDDRRSFYNEDTGVYYNVTSVAPPPTYPALDFRPTILMRPVLIALTITYTGVVIGLVAMLLKAGSDRQLRTLSNNAYIVARYIPVTLGTITLVLFRNMASQLFRLMPYIAMADQGESRTGAKARHSIAAMYYPVHYPFKPNTTLGWFKCFSVFFTGFIVSLKTVLLTIDREENFWVVTIHATPAKVLIGGYSLMVLFTITVTTYLWSRSTGLQTGWNPASIADIVALFTHFNVSLDGIELEHNRHVYDIAYPNLMYRLGYWQLESTDKLEKFYVYGIRALNMEKSEAWIGPARTPTIPISRDKSRVPPVSVAEPEAQQSDGDDSGFVADAFIGQDSSERPSINPPLLHSPVRSNLDSVGSIGDGPQPSEQSCSCTDPGCVHYPYRQTVFYSQFGLIFWLSVIVGAMALLLYCLCVGYAEHGFTLNNTWYEYVTYRPTTANSTTSTDTAGNQTFGTGSEWMWGSWAPDPQHDLVLYAVVFRSIPAYVAGFFTETFLGLIDTNHRFIQPFLNMYQTPGTPSQTILLDYMTISPVEVSLLAWNNGHWKVAWFSFVCCISPLFPIVVISLNSFTNTGTDIILEFSSTAFVFLFLWLILYAVTLGLAWPVTKRLVPRSFNCLLDILALCHQSHFLQRPEFKACQTWWKKESLKDHISIRDDRYLFGHYRGVDKKIHLGFDVAETHAKHFLNYGAVSDEGQSTGLVQRIAPLTTKERREHRRKAKREAKRARQKQAKLEGLAHSRPRKAFTRVERVEEDIEMVHMV